MGLHSGSPFVPSSRHRRLALLFVYTIFAEESENSLLSLTVSRNPDADHSLFVPEVSGDLVAWCSDSEHVTILEDTPSLLRASDNTPLTGAAPRFMRLRVVVSAE